MGLGQGFTVSTSPLHMTAWEFDEDRIPTRTCAWWNARDTPVLRLLQAASRDRQRFELRKSRICLITMSSGRVAGLSLHVLSEAVWMSGDRIEKRHETQVAYGPVRLLHVNAKNLAPLSHTYRTLACASISMSLSRSIPISLSDWPTEDNAASRSFRNPACMTRQGGRPGNRQDE